MYFQEHMVTEFALDMAERLRVHQEDKKIVTKTETTMSGREMKYIIFNKIVYVCQMRKVVISVCVTFQLIQVSSEIQCVTYCLREFPDLINL